jgi:hypothetical protein
LHNFRYFLSSQRLQNCIRVAILAMRSQLWLCFRSIVKKDGTLLSISDFFL